MVAHANLPIEPWAEYQTHLAPFTSKAAFGMALGPRVEDKPGAFEGFQAVFKNLNVDLFLYANAGRYEFHIVQLGEDVPDCERLIYMRPGRERANEYTLWETNPEHFRSSILNDALLNTLVQERQQRALQRAFAAIEIAEQAYWQLYKLTNERGDTWHKTAANLQALHGRGHSWQALHDMLHHYPRWVARHPEFEGMPRELVVRTHGLGGTLQMLGPHSGD